MRAILLATAILLAACACRAGETYTISSNPSTAEKIVRIDSGQKVSRKLDVTRVQSLLTQMASRYTTNEIAVADCAVRARDILREKYGIATKLQPLLEDLNRINCRTGKPDDLNGSAVLYIQQRNQGKDGREAVEAINEAINK
jgi:hypothetical protein